MRLLALLLVSWCVLAQDSDRDGISDAEEQLLMERFQPRFLVSASECSGLPVSLKAGAAELEVAESDGTIYAQVLPVAAGIEIHYFHVWANDCGRMGHPWDFEHVSVLVRDGEAKYWLATAHQDTVCDNANAARAAVLDAVRQGATVWISRGKHASYLSESLCRKGCGGDSCDAMIEMPVARVINLGEWSTPTEGNGWIRSPLLRAEKKMTAEISPQLAAALEKGGVKPVYPIRIPGQAAIYGLNTAVNGLGVADKHTGNALGTAERKTRGAFGRAKQWVKDRLEE